MNFELKSKNAAAEAKSLGGELISYVKDGTEYVWQGHPEHWSGQAPVLFPVLCRAKDDKIIADGREYDMPKHGLARKCEFTPVDVQPSKITFELHENDELLKKYPYPFSLAITHEITDEGFSTQYSVTNTGSSPMTFVIGGHPGFSCPLHEGERFEDYSLIFADCDGYVMSLTQPGTGYMDSSMPKLSLIKNGELPLRYSDYDNDALVIENLKKSSLSLINRTTRRGFRFDFDGFDAIGIWTPIKKNSPFICLEPWCGLPGALEETPELTSKKYARTLEAGGNFTVAYKMTII